MMQVSRLTLLYAESRQAKTRTLGSGSDSSCRRRRSSLFLIFLLVCFVLFQLILVAQGKRLLAEEGGGFAFLGGVLGRSKTFLGNLLIIVASSFYNTKWLRGTKRFKLVSRLLRIILLFVKKVTYILSSGKLF